jgi:hypothetical protein
MSKLLSVRVSVNMRWGYDYCDLTEEDLLNNYCIYAGNLIKKTMIKDASWLNGAEAATPAELFNYELLNWDDKETVSYCKIAYDKKYPSD